MGRKKTQFFCLTLKTKIQTLSLDNGCFWLWTGEMLWFTCTNKTRATIIFTVDYMCLGIRNFVCMQIMNRIMNHLLNIIDKSEIKKNCHKLKLKF